MDKELALLVVHPKAERHVTNILPILEERWDTTYRVTAYAGQGIELAEQAFQQNYRWIISLGGDGTLNEVVNGAMQAQHLCTVATLPGGTVNQWAHEIGLPAHPVEAAQVLVRSIHRNVDIGFIEVQALAFADEIYVQPGTQGIANARHHFLIIAGLGVDAVTIQSTNESSKQHYGQLAFLLDWLQILPTLRPFPAQISWSNTQSWQGQPWDILVSNTRRYANVSNLIQAYVNDGLHDIRIFSLEPVLLTSFQDHTFSVKVPASVAIELDGSGVSLTDYLSVENRERLRQATDQGKVMVTYAFTTKPSALPMAIPAEYRGELFK